MNLYKISYLEGGIEKSIYLYANSPIEAEEDIIKWLIESGQWADCKITDVEEVSCGNKFCH